MIRDKGNGFSYKNKFRQYSLLNTFIHLLEITFQLANSNRYIQQGDYYTYYKTYIMCGGIIYIYQHN
uniref:Uncharacterized protein n=1 Tax=Meloidogyne enterolobii TaxID=390850 RepID=A0A6V7XPQ2_MELEN|nr:unnamed protein product [Meloidogyne enterolobii]